MCYSEQILINNSVFIVCQEIWICCFLSSHKINFHRNARWLHCNYKKEKNNFCYIVWLCYLTKTKYMYHKVNPYIYIYIYVPVYIFYTKACLVNKYFLRSQQICVDHPHIQKDNICWILKFKLNKGFPIHVMRKCKWLK